MVWFADGAITPPHMGLVWGLRLQKFSQKINVKIAHFCHIVDFSLEIFSVVCVV